jgi:AcrR family transcriptional regulator
MPDALQEGTLAGTHDGKPGLPRGRSRLPVPDVRASQLRRLRRATVAAVAEAGYSAVTVADIVRRARVSRAAFYDHFADKEDAFLAATREGGQLMSDRVLAAARAVPAGAPDEDALRAACRAFLEFLGTEPAFARVFYIDMPSAGPRAVERFEQAGRRFAAMTAAWHERARTRHPDWPVVPDDAYLGLAGAFAELVRVQVRADRAKALPELEDTLVSLHLAVLAARPWPAPSALPSPDPPTPHSAVPHSAVSHSPMPPSLTWPLSRLRAMVRRWISSVPS